MLRVRKSCIFWRRSIRYHPRVVKKGVEHNLNSRLNTVNSEHYIRMETGFATQLQLESRVTRHELRVASRKMHTVVKGVLGRTHAQAATILRFPFCHKSRTEYTSREWNTTKINEQPNSEVHTNNPKPTQHNSNELFHRSYVTSFMIIFIFWTLLWYVGHGTSSKQKGWTVRDKFIHSWDCEPDHKRPRWLRSAVLSLELRESPWVQNALAWTGHNMFWNINIGAMRWSNPWELITDVGNSDLPRYFVTSLPISTWNASALGAYISKCCDLFTTMRSHIFISEYAIGLISSSCSPLAHCQALWRATTDWSYLNDYLLRLLATRQQIVIVQQIIIIQQRMIDGPRSYRSTLFRFHGNVIGCS